MAGCIVQQLSPACAAVYQWLRNPEPWRSETACLEDLAVEVQGLAGQRALDDPHRLARGRQALPVVDTHDPVPLATGADHDARAPAGVFGQGADGIGNLQRVHLVGADHHDAGAQALRGHGQRDRGQKSVACPAIVLDPQRAEAISLCHQAQLPDFARREVGFENEIQFHVSPPRLLRYLRCGKI
jgi:hypothetical protein